MLQMPEKAKENVERIRSKKSFWDYRPRPIRWLEMYGNATRMLSGMIASAGSLIGFVVLIILLVKANSVLGSIMSVPLFLAGIYFYVWFAGYAFDW
ncbi:MAG: hypothetical protein ACXQTL_07540 [Methanosarcinales archaeon]